MPRYDYCHDRKVWVKQCSSCKEFVLGTEDQWASEEIFKKAFGVALGSAGMADGLQSRCRGCNSNKRRELGVTQQILINMWNSQNGKCIICDKYISIERNAPADYHAHVDHDDDTGVIRGLLCGACNRDIGMFKHEPDLIRRAADYCAWHNRFKRSA